MQLGKHMFSLGHRVWGIGRTPARTICLRTRGQSLDLGEERFLRLEQLTLVETKEKGQLPMG